MKKFKNKWAVTGDPILRRAFIEKAGEIGYELFVGSDLSLKSLNEWSHAYNDYNEMGNKFIGNAKDPRNIRPSSHIVFSLPEQWDEAIKFAAETETELPEYAKLLRAGRAVEANSNTEIVVGRIYHKSNTEFVNPHYNFGAMYAFGEGLIQLAFNTEKDYSCLEPSTKEEYEAGLIKNETEKRGLKVGMKMKPTKLENGAWDIKSEQDYELGNKQWVGTIEDFAVVGDKVGFITPDSNSVFYLSHHEPVQAATKLMFGDVEFTIENGLAKCGYGNVTKDEIKKILDWFAAAPKLCGYPMKDSDGCEVSKLGDGDKLGFGCKKGTIGELRKIYEAMGEPVDAGFKFDKQYIDGKWAFSIFDKEREGWRYDGYGKSGHLSSLFLTDARGQWYDEDGNKIGGYLYYKPKQAAKENVVTKSNHTGSPRIDFDINNAWAFTILNGRTEGKNNKGAEFGRAELYLNDNYGTWYKEDGTVIKGYLYYR